MTYAVKATREDDWWTLVADLGDREVASQVRRLDQAVAAIQEAISLVLDIEDDWSIDVKLDIAIPDGTTADLVTEASWLRAIQDVLDRTLVRRTALAVERLRERGFTVRDTAGLLGITPSRVSQIEAAMLEETAAPVWTPQDRQIRPLLDALVHQLAGVEEDLEPLDVTDSLDELAEVLQEWTEINKVIPPTAVHVPWSWLTESQNRPSEIDPLRARGSLATLSERRPDRATVAKGDIHVTPDDKGKGWKVSREGQGRAIARTDTQAEAADRGRQAARNSKVEFNLHGRDGRVREKDSYGNDPRNIKG